MSGTGLVSIRLPRSVMEAFEANAFRAGMDKHDATRRLVSCLERFTDDELTALPEPLRESDNPRLSLYVGWPHAETLATVSRRTQLSTSCIVRRLVYGLVVTGAIKVAPTGQVHELDLAPVQHSIEGPNCGSYGSMILLAVLALAIIGLVLRYRWIKTRRTSLKTVSRKPSPSLSEDPKGADLQ
jgi:hypothetical protein